MFRFEPVRRAKMGDFPRSWDRRPQGIIKRREAYLRPLFWAYNGYWLAAVKVCPPRGSFLRLKEYVCPLRS